MKLWVGVTDGNWFEFLRARQPDEVNFWQPSGSRQFKVLEPGEPFLFKLHSPRNFIVGGGFFVRYTAIQCTVAWRAFAEKNGVADFASFLARIYKYRRGEARDLDPIVGCNILTEPFFWPERDWIPVPTGWAPNIVQGKSYDSREPLALTSGLPPYSALGRPAISAISINRRVMAANTSLAPGSAKARSESS